MSPSTLRILIAVFLIAHGLVHFILTAVPTPPEGGPVGQPGGVHTPFWPSWWRAATDPTWLASRMGLPQRAVRLFGSCLWLAALIGFALAGLGLLGLPGFSAIWPGAAAGGALASLLLLGFYGHPWLVVGAVIDLAVLASLWLHVPGSIFHVQ
jgi:hypothetical protein